MPLLSVSPAALFKASAGLPSKLCEIVVDGLVVDGDFGGDLGVDVLESVGDAAKMKADAEQDEADGCKAKSE